MKKIMLADVIKDIKEDKIQEIIAEGGVSREIAMQFLDEGYQWPLNDDNSYMWWIENVREDIESDQFNFRIMPSRSSRPKNMHDNPGLVSAEIFPDSIGPTGSDEAIYSVDVVWPAGSTEAPDTRTYEIPYSIIYQWSQDSSGTYFNANIRGNYFPGNRPIS